MSIVHFVPSMLGEFLTTATSEPASPVLDASALRLIVCSGEPLTAQHAQSTATVFPRATLLNLYGPTEAAIDVTAENVSARGPVAGLSVAIGTPVWNTYCRILDHTLAEVLPGAEGDLYLGGTQLARAYHDKAALTASRFVADPGPTSPVPASTTPATVRGNDVTAVSSISAARTARSSWPANVSNWPRWRPRFAPIPASGRAPRPNRSRQPGRDSSDTSSQMPERLCSRTIFASRSPVSSPRRGFRLVSQSWTRSR